jgi:hypothetical protein
MGECMLRRMLFRNGFAFTRFGSLSMPNQSRSETVVLLLTIFAIHLCLLRLFHYDLTIDGIKDAFVGNVISYLVIYILLLIASLINSYVRQSPNRFSVVNLYIFLLDIIPWVPVFFNKSYIGTFRFDGKSIITNSEITPFGIRFVYTEAVVALCTILLSFVFIQMLASNRTAKTD